MKKIIITAIIAMQSLIISTQAHAISIPQLPPQSLSDSSVQYFIQRHWLVRITVTRVFDSTAVCRFLSGPFENNTALIDRYETFHTKKTFIAPLPDSLVICYYDDLQILGQGDTVFTVPKEQGHSPWLSFFGNSKCSYGICLNGDHIEITEYRISRDYSVWIFFLFIAALSGAMVTFSGKFISTILFVIIEVVIHMLLKMTTLQGDVRAYLLPTVVTLAVWAVISFVMTRNSKSK